MTRAPSPPGHAQPNARPEGPAVVKPAPPSDPRFPPKQVTGEARLPTRRSGRTTVVRISAWVHIRPREPIPPEADPNTRSGSSIWPRPHRPRRDHNLRGRPSHAPVPLPRRRSRPGDRRTSGCRPRRPRMRPRMGERNRDSYRRSHAIPGFSAIAARHRRTADRRGTGLCIHRRRSLDHYPLARFSQRLIRPSLPARPNSTGSSDKRSSTRHETCPSGATSTSTSTPLLCHSSWSPPRTVGTTAGQSMPCATYSRRNSMVRRKAASDTGLALRESHPLGSATSSAIRSMSGIRTSRIARSMPVGTTLS